VSNAPSAQPISHFEFNLQGQRVTNTLVHPSNGDASGYDTVSDMGCAKNILTVGAVFPGAFSSPTNVVWAPFSSCGPTDDGRIKPDLVGAGISIITCNYSNDFSYDFFNGTSFSCPSVAGSINLLAQYYRQLHPSAPDPLASTLKALVIQTADPTTTNSGPSYRAGWGLMNTAKAAGLTANDATNGLKNFIKEVMLTNGTYIQFPVTALGGTNALKITTCWTDPYGPSSMTWTSVSSLPAARQTSPGCSTQTLPTKPHRPARLLPPRAMITAITLSRSTLLSRPTLRTLCE
jgi:subtilisin family serine protease